MVLRVTKHVVRLHTLREKDESVRSSRNLRKRKARHTIGLVSSTLPARIVTSLNCTLQKRNIEQKSKKIKMERKQGMDAWQKQLLARLRSILGELTNCVTAFSVFRFFSFLLKLRIGYIQTTSTKRYTNEAARSSTSMRAPSLQANFIQLTSILTMTRLQWRASMSRLTMWITLYEITLN